MKKSKNWKAAPSRQGSSNEAVALDARRRLEEGVVASRIDVLKEMLRAWGVNPEEVQVTTATREEARGPGGRAIAEPGSVVYVRYLDHVLFRDAYPGAYKPFVREFVGWVDHENDDYLRITFERFAGLDTRGETEQKATGLVILKSSILELRRIG